MVSYYNPAVGMFGHSGSGHYHPHHQSSGGSNPYFTPPYGGYPAAHPHAHAHHVARHGGSGAGSGGTVVPGVTSSQFSPKMTPDFNYNHQYPHQFAHMSPDSAAIAAAASASPWSHTGAGNVYNPCHRSYDEWSQRTQHQVNHHAAASLHSFYSHQQPSPPSSNPSPNPGKLGFGGGGGGGGGGHGHESGESGGANSSNQYNNNGGFKTEFGPLSGDGNSISQENPSLESMRQGGRGGAGEIVSSVTTSIATPHSPDSGMAISDGVSSSGSPATGMGGGGQHCFGDGGGSLQLASPGTGLNENMIEGSGENMSNNLNQQSIHNQQRPAQARSPFEWMKKPAYSVSSNSSNGKTRTKDKYRVVYTDTQRLELEKEFHYNRYITIRRKAELASILGLSERQVKIWFQNRRAKERKVVRKREEMIHREKIATMVHMQSAVAGAAGMGQVNNNYSL